MCLLIYDDVTTQNVAGASSCDTTSCLSTAHDTCHVCQWSICTLFAYPKVGRQL